MRGWILGIVAATCACGKGETGGKASAAPDAAPVKTPDAKVVAVTTPDATPKPDVKALAVELNEEWTKVKEACVGGDGEACDKLGEALLGAKGGAPKDLAAGRTLLEYGCDALDHGGSCVSMASAASRGELGKKDAALSAKYWSRACDVGNPGGCQNYGARLIDGIEGVPADPQRGQRLLESACEKDRAVACSILATHLTSGKLQARDGRTADWYRKRACDLGMADFCEPR
jgi:TPR repeat protein